MAYYMENDSLPTSLPFNLRPREMTVAAIASLFIFFLAFFGVSFATAGSGAVATGPVKSDRQAIGYENACAGQAWGNWSEDCLKALSKKQNLNLAPSRTVEFRDADQQLSVLTRTPRRS